MERGDGGVWVIVRMSTMAPLRHSFRSDSLRLVFLPEAASEKRARLGGAQAARNPHLSGAQAAPERRRGGTSCRSSACCRAN